MTYTPVDVVEVRAWGRTVGAVALDPATQFYAFEYAPEWLDDGVELAPLHLPVRPGVFTFPDLAPQTFHRLPALLADALPDRFGNALVDAWMAQQGVHSGEVTPLDRLAYAADRGMGALTFRPPADRPQSATTAVNLAELVTAARSAVRGDLTHTDALADFVAQLIQVGTSAGGARAKAVIAYHPQTGQLRSGQVDAGPGFEQWLIKLDGVSGDPTRDGDPLADGQEYCRIEYAYALMAQRAGLDMSECRLLPEGPRTHFMTKRFDRGDDGERLHLITLCALAHLDFNLPTVHSYDQYLQTIGALGLGADAREQAFRRMVFNVLAVNRDDHTKNLAFIRREHGEWELAPAYDITHAHNPQGRWTARHQMSVGGVFDAVTLTDLDAFADRHEVPDHRRLLGEVAAAVDAWPEFATAAGLSADATARIAADHAAVRISGDATAVGPR
jgi:serine/threonine-protein kinase HipA